MFSSASPNKRSRSEKEDKLNRREQGWRRMVLRMLMVLANALRIITRQAQGMIKQLGREDLRQLKESIQEILEEEESSSEESAAPTEAASTAGSFVVIPPAGPPCPDGRHCCHHGQESVILMCRKEGPNYQRQFRRCPLWKRPDLRCDYFQWLDHQPYWKDPDASKKKLTDEMKELTEEQRKCKHPIVVGTGLQVLSLVQMDADQSGGPPSPSLSIQTMDLVSMMGDNTPRSAPPTPPKPSKSPAKTVRKDTNASKKPPSGKQPPKDEDTDATYQQFLEWQQFREFSRKSQSSSSKSQLGREF
ncbi:unnamed protein product [Symbiodinium sp. CCMP2592]|nr:unnamed protein product [Symbiodinium sp. CCMP2592]